MSSPLMHPQLDEALWPLPGRLFVRLDSEPTQSRGGIIYPDVAVPSVSQGEVLAIGDGISTGMMRRRVAIVPASGSRLDISAPRLMLPADIIEIDEGDILAVWDDAFAFDCHADVPKESIARRWSPIADHVLIRTYNPASVYTGGLIAQKNEKFPKIWAHLLTVPFDLVREHPAAVPGALVIFDRYAEELLGHDYCGHRDSFDLPVAIVRIGAVRCVVNPAPVTMEAD